MDDADSILSPSLTRNGGGDRYTLSGLIVAGTMLGLLPEGRSASGRLGGVRPFCRLHGLVPAIEPHELSAFAHDGDLLGTEAPSLDALGTGPVNVFGAGDGVSDVWFVNSRRLRVRFTPNCPVDGEVTCRAFQATSPAGGVVAIGEARMSLGDLAFLDTVLVNPLLPVLFVTTDEHDEVLATSVLPFPSLCRGGLHYAELCATARTPELTSGLAALSATLLDALLARLDAGRAPLVNRVEVDLRGAIGAEPIFSADVNDWLSGMSVIDLVAANASTITNGEVRAFLEARLARSCPGDLSSRGDSGLGSSTLSLPPNAIPSLHAVVAAGDPGWAGVFTTPFLVAENGTAMPLWAIAMPAMAEPLLALQPAGAASAFPVLRASEGSLGYGGQPRAAPFAIRYVDNPPLGSKISLLMPFSPECPVALLGPKPPDDWRVTVLIPEVEEFGEGLTALLESLRLQDAADRMDVVVVTSDQAPHAARPAERELRRLFDGRFTLLRDASVSGRAERLDLAAAATDAPMLLVAVGHLVLHDHRTVHVLGGLAGQDWVGSSGCLLVRAGLSKKEQEIVPYSGGYFPIVPAGTADPMFDRVAEFGSQTIFPLATYPVAANPANLFMVRAETVRRCGGFAAAAPDMWNLAFAARAQGLGLAHLCTSAVSAGIRMKALPPGDRSVPIPPMAAEVARPLAAGVGRLMG